MLFLNNKNEECWTFFLGRPYFIVFPAFFSATSEPTFEPSRSGMEFMEATLSLTLRVAFFFAFRSTDDSEH